MGQPLQALQISECLLGAVAQRDFIHHVRIVSRVHDGRRSEGLRRRFHAIDNRVVQHRCGGVADIQAGDEQPGLEAGGLIRSPELAGFVGAETDANDVIGA